MHAMSAQVKHLIDPEPLRDSAAVTGTPCCRVAEALAGDCRSPILERLKVVEAECRFGLNCTRNCAQGTAAGFGFAGEAIVLGGRIAADPAAASAEDDHDF